MSIDDTNKSEQKKKNDEEVIAHKKHLVWLVN